MNTTLDALEAFGGAVDVSHPPFCARCVFDAHGTEVGKANPEP